MNTGEALLSVISFLQIVFVRMFDKKVPLPQDDKIWHLLFYKLKKKYPQSPWLKKLLFDWDDSSPTCRYLQEVLDIFRGTGALLRICPSGENQFRSDMIALWRHEHADYMSTIGPLADESVKMLEELVRRAQ
jgi:hypothetical protein